jgi:hypothetical protein
MTDCLDWMDDATKEMAKKKAKTMVEHIGFPSGIKLRRSVKALMR